MVLDPMAVPAAASGAASLTGLALRPGWPLRLWRYPPLTLAVVSVAWLRELGERDRSEIAHRHLDSGEAAQAACLRPTRRRHEWLAGRLAIKHCAVAHQLGHGGQRIPARQVRVGMVAAGLRQGRPLISVPADVSMSHSADFATAVCGPLPVGIDLERTRELAPTLADALRADEVGEMPLTLRWSCKEAVLKCLGVGLRIDPREVMLTSWDPGGWVGWDAGPRLRAALPRTDPQCLRTWAREIDGYCVALSWTMGRETHGTRTS